MPLMDNHDVEPEDKTFDEMVDDVKPISAGTITRTIITLLSVINAVFLMFGKNLGLDAVDSGALYDFVSAVMLIGATGWAWWKNNNVTRNARKK